MKAEIICVGTELLLGNIVNTNASYLARKCAEFGLSLYNQQVVGDNEERLKEAVLLALDRSDVIITSGGLGPTDDDLTKEVVCKTLGIEMVPDKGAMDAMTSYFHKMGRYHIDIINNKQALIPVGGKALLNSNGTAPAVMIETDNTAAKDSFPNKVIFLLPGPPSELIPLVDKYLKPYFNNILSETIYSETLKLIGIGESEAATKIEKLLKESVNPTVAPYAKPGELHLRITAKAKDEEAAVKMIYPVKAQILSVLGKYVYTDREDDTLEDVVIKQAVKKGLKIAAAESCTGGLISGRLVNVSGASASFIQGFVTYSNEAKIASLGVSSDILESFGAVSEECAAAMAEGAAKHSGADIAVSTTGIAGPDGGTDEKPVGLVYIGLYYKGNTKVKKYNFNGNRQIVRNRAVSCALNMLWEALNEKSLY